MHLAGQLSRHPLGDAVAAVSVGIVDGVPMLDLALRGGLERRGRHERGHDRDRTLRRGPGHGRGPALLEGGARRPAGPRRGGHRHPGGRAGSRPGRPPAPPGAPASAGDRGPHPTGAGHGQPRQGPGDRRRPAGRRGGPTCARPAEVAEVEETGETLVDNARLKARALAEATGRASVADDTGLEVDALGGAPGVYSARFAGPEAAYADNVARLLADLGRAVAALGVAAIVIWISMKLGKKSVRRSVGHRARQIAGAGFRRRPAVPGSRTSRGCGCPQRAGNLRRRDAHRRPRRGVRAGARHRPRGRGRGRRGAAEGRRGGSRRAAVRVRRTLPPSCVCWPRGMASGARHSHLRGKSTAVAGTAPRGERFAPVGRSPSPGDGVRAGVAQAFPGVTRIITHIEPTGDAVATIRGEPAGQSEVQKAIADFLRDYPLPVKPQTSRPNRRRRVGRLLPLHVGRLDRDHRGPQLNGAVGRVSPRPRAGPRPRGDSRRAEQGEAGVDKRKWRDERHLNRRELLIFLGIITGIDSFGMLLPSPNVTSICATLLLGCTCSCGCYA